MELSRRFRACRVSGATKLQQVKIRTCEKLACFKAAGRGDRKRKSPALPGFFDEYLFRSVHFASLAI
jgi:hypothetical protein